MSLLSVPGFPDVLVPFKTALLDNKLCWPQSLSIETETSLTAHNSNLIQDRTAQLVNNMRAIFCSLAAESIVIHHLTRPGTLHRSLVG